MGVKELKIIRPVKIGLLSTGDELVNADFDELPKGKIRDSNKILL